MTELWFNFVCIINRSVTLDFMPTACSWHKKMLEPCFETNLIQSYNFQYAVQQEIIILNCAVSLILKGRYC